MDHPESVETFSIPQAADALGRSLATLRRWIEADKVPAPYLEEVVRKNKVYSVGELQTIARVISQHERDFIYLATQHSHIVETLRQAVHAYRAEYI